MFCRDIGILEMEHKDLRRISSVENFTKHSGSGLLLNGHPTVTAGNLIDIENYPKSKLTIWSYFYLILIYNNFLALPDCTCTNFINERGYGNCQRLSRSGKMSCYVNEPSNCDDLKISKSTGKAYSSDACLSYSGIYLEIW